jgi:hypothetical protein
MYKKWDLLGDEDTAEAAVKEEVKVETTMESDEIFFKKENLEKRKTPQNRPLSLWIPRSRWIGSNQPPDV